MANTKKYADLLVDLKARGANAKVAAAKKADDNSKVAPEKDPADKGNPGTPPYPNASAAAQNLPESKTNTEETPVYMPKPPAKTVDGTEKMAGKLTTKVASLLKAAQSLRKSAGGTAEEISTQGGLPASANKNDQKEGNPPKPAPAGGKADPAVKDAGKEKMEKDRTMEMAAMPKEDSKGAIPADETNKEAAADVDLANIDHTFFSKLAQTCMQFEEGRNIMEMCLKKAHGAEHASNLIKTAMFMDQKMQELQALEEEGVSAAEQFWKSASEADRLGLIKLASVHDQALKSFSSFPELERDAYLEGAKIAAEMADAGMAGAQPPPGVPGMGGEGDPAAGAGAAGAGAEGGGEVSDDDIIQALQMLVQQGKISEEEAETILQQLLGGQGEQAGGGAGGAPPGAAAPSPEMAAGGGAGGPPPEMAGAAGGPPPDEKATPDEKSAAEHLKSVGQAVDAVFAALSGK